jgi:hypothetical protein
MKAVKNNLKGQSSEILIPFLTHMDMPRVHDSAEFKNKHICPVDAWFIFNLRKKIELITGIHNQLL